MGYSEATEVRAVVKARLRISLIENKTAFFYSPLRASYLSENLRRIGSVKHHEGYLASSITVRVAAITADERCTGQPENCDTQFACTVRTGDTSSKSIYEGVYFWVPQRLVVRREPVNIIR